MFGLRSVMWGMFWSCIAALIAWTVMVLFGAPLFDLVERTWLAAIAFALIALFPVGATLKGDGDLWMHVFRPSSSTSSPIQSLVTIPLVGATIGAWASAVALPLDWQTEWQRWPVASNYGALIGYQIGLFAAIITCKLQSKHGD
ncbi:GPI biosynthesis protein Pig-F [Gaertneriomyces semiglobifer]|nr:GPI biosynthesis protein Pig-F [Gaertneriomyces semiglobifer]